MKLKPNQKILFVLIIILFIVLIFKLVLTRFITNDNGFFINLITEIIGAGITFFAIDRTITLNEIQTKNEYRKIALRALCSPIKNYVSMWLHIGFESEEKAKSEIGKYLLSELLTSDPFIENIKNRDFSDFYNNMTYSGQQDDRILKDIIPVSFKSIKDNLKLAINKYAIYYDPETLYLLEHFAEKSHLYEVFDFWISVKGGEHKKWFQSEQLKKEYFQQHFSRLLALIEKYNNSVKGDDLINSQTFLTFKKFDDKVEY